MAKEVFEHQNEWIVEGTTRRMVKLGLDQADTIFYLTYKNTFQQIYTLYKRYRSREHETFPDLFKLIVHQIKKRKRWGHFKQQESFEDLLKPHTNKVIRMESFEEIDNYLNNLQSL